MTKQISNDKTAIKDRKYDNGVYRLNFKLGNITYIGETSEKFSTKIKEHETLQILRDNKSRFGKHSDHNQHPIKVLG